MVDNFKIRPYADGSASKRLDQFGFEKGLSMTPEQALIELVPEGGSMSYQSWIDEARNQRLAVNNRIIQAARHSPDLSFTLEQDENGAWVHTVHRA